MTEKEREYIPYIINKWYWWRSENEFMSSWSDFSYSENINIYESPKYIELSKAFDAIGVETLTTDSTEVIASSLISSNKFYWVRFTSKKTQTLTKVTKISTCTATRAYIYDETLTTLLDSWLFSWTDTVAFTEQLIAWIKYCVVLSDAGWVYNVIEKSWVTYPDDETNITYTDWASLEVWQAPVFSTTKSWNIESIETEATSLVVTSWYTTKILRLPNDIQSNAYFTSVGEIYIDAGSWPVLVHTLVDADKYILNAVCFTTFLLFFTATDIHKITFTWNDFKTFASCNEAILSFTSSYPGFSTNESKDLCIYNFKDTLLYFSAGNILYSVWNTLSAVSTSETLRKWSKIVWLSFLNSNLKIYVNYLNVKSSLYFRSETASDSINYNNRVFKSVVTDWQLDYAVCSDGLYIYNGYSWEKVFNYNFNDFWKSWSGYYVPQNLMGIDPYFWYIAYNKNIFKFWRKFTNLPQAFSLSSVEANNITAFSDEIPITWTLYYSSDDKKTFYQWSTYKTTWYFEWIVFYWESMEKIKKIDRIFNAFDIPTWCSIDVYFSKEWWAYPVTPNYTMTASSTVKYKELFANELAALTNHWFKPKFVLNGNWTTTPKFYEFAMFSEYVKNI